MFPLSNPILIFTILILVILIAPLLANRLSVPDLVLLLVAGVLLGENGFGVLERDAAVTLFASVGLLYIMFLAGLEIDTHRFAQTGRRSIVFGILTFAIPQTLGTLAGRYLLHFEWPTSVLLASMFASHTLLSYPIASRLGISKSEPVAVTVGATIITDMLALMVLAIIADSARGINLGLGFWIGISAGMTSLILITWMGIPRLARWFFSNVTEAGGAQFLFVIATVCACAYLSYFAKMEPIIGAFLAGIAFNRLIPEHSVLMNRVVFVGNTLFIPFFLISVGMLVDPGALIHNPQSWVVTVTMVVAVIITKYAASWIAGKFFGYKTNARRVMFGLSVVQAAATLAAVLVGYDLGIFDDTVLNGAIAMIAVTCPLGAWMVDRYGRKMAEQIASRKSVSEISQRILVTVANPATAIKTLDLAFMLRDKSKPGSIHPVTIVREQDDIDEAVARGERLLAHCLTHAGSADIPVSPSVRVDVNISDGIIRSAKELRANLVLVGWEEQKTTSTRLFGTVMENLIDDCPQRILFCRIVQPLNNTGRLLIFLPPLVERRCDLTPLLKDIKFLSKQVGSEMRVYLAVTNSAELIKKIDDTHPSRPLTVVEETSFVKARSRLFNEIGRNDTLILLSERKNSVLWTPTLDKLSEMVASRFPNNNLLVSYPSMIPCENDTPQEDEDADNDLFILCPYDLRAGISLEKALYEMTETAFPKMAEIASEARRRLLAVAKSYPVQMSAEAVLLHVHCEKLEHPVLIVGSGRSFPEIVDIKPTPRIILALLNPKSISTERHLKSLAKLGRLFYDKEKVEMIKNATSASEICGIIGM